MSGCAVCGSQRIAIGVDGRRLGCAGCLKLSKISKMREVKDRPPAFDCCDVPMNRLSNKIGGRSVYECGTCGAWRTNSIRRCT